MRRHATGFRRRLKNLYRMSRLGCVICSRKAHRACAHHYNMTHVAKFSDLHSPSFCTIGYGVFTIKPSGVRTHPRDASRMAKAAAADIREFARFFVAGVTATVGNIIAVWFARFFVSFEIALLVGIAVGVTISFILSKLFAFASRSWERAGGEAGRFLIVYAMSCAIYWVMALVCGRFVLVHVVAPRTAELGGVFIGAGTMMLTSYFGHRFFTYRTYLRAADRLGSAS
jgi:putative flippase GtrA